MSRLWTFSGSEIDGDWAVASHTVIKGDDPLPSKAKFVNIIQPSAAAVSDGTSGHDEQPIWFLQGVTSNERYVTKAEKTDLVAKQAGIGRESCKCAALILLRKDPSW